MIIEFTLRGLPKTTNSNKGHWRSIKANADKWKRAVVDHIITKRLKPPFPFRRAKLTLIRHSSQAPDYDGLVSSGKHIWDGLIIAKVIEDDSMEHVGVPTYSWQKAKMRKGCITIKVEKLDDNFSWDA